MNPSPAAGESLTEALRAIDRERRRLQKRMQHCFERTTTLERELELLERERERCDRKLQEIDVALASLTTVAQGLPKATVRARAKRGGLPAPATQQGRMLAIIQAAGGPISTADVSAKLGQRVSGARFVELKRRGLIDSVSRGVYVAVPLEQAS